jgi:predicted metal-dependent hydrolase
VLGSKLFNEHDFYQGHDEWEEVWRRATGTRRRLLHGLIQVAVGYEHLRRGNPKGMRSLLRQGAAKIRFFTRRPGVKELRERALADAKRAESDSKISLRSSPPPKVMVGLEGFRAAAPRGSIRVQVPPPPTA